MIQYFYENITETVDQNYKIWLQEIIISEQKKIGEINYIFCDDTDIITFDYVKGKTISGEIFVSLQRISDNASTLLKNYEDELRRVLAHGILHLCGYKDKSEEEEKEMRNKEDFYLNKYSK